MSSQSEADYFQRETTSTHLLSKLMICPGITRPNHIAFNICIGQIMLEQFNLFNLPINFCHCEPPHLLFGGVAIFSMLIGNYISKRLVCASYC